jgi:hypothetical protein
MYGCGLISGLDDIVVEVGDATAPTGTGVADGAVPANDGGRSLEDAGVIQDASAGDARTDATLEGPLDGAPGSDGGGEGGADASVPDAPIPDASVPDAAARDAADSSTINQLPGGGYIVFTEPVPPVPAFEQGPTQVAFAQFFPSGNSSYYSTNESPQGSVPSGCTTTPYGSCVYSQCAATGMTEPVEAGTVTISGGTLPANATMRWFGAGDDAYTYTAPPGPDGGDLLVFKPGDVLSVSSTGNSFVPAFGPEQIVMSTPAVLTSPLDKADANATSVTVNTSADLSLTWSGGVAPDQFFAEILGVYVAGQSTGIRFLLCTWDASAGQGTMPQAGLTQLLTPSPDAGTSSCDPICDVALYTGTQRVGSFYAGAYAIGLVAQQADSLSDVFLQ